MKVKALTKIGVHLDTQVCLHRHILARIKANLTKRNGRRRMGIYGRIPAESGDRYGEKIELVVGFLLNIWRLVF